MDNTSQKSNFLYTGNSMKPTFKPLDNLLIEFKGVYEVRIGDIVVFDSTNNTQRIVHRVISKNELGLITQGDNILHPDRDIVTSRGLIGRVRAFERGGKTITVRGGKIENYRVKLRRYFRKLGKQLKKSKYLVRFNSIYAAIPLHKVIPIQKMTHTVFLKVENEYELQLFLGKFRIGKFTSKDCIWRILWFIRPFINISELPETLLD